MITILCGKSASGKDTLLRELIKDGYFEPLVSTTTRPMRDGEVQDKDYHFVSPERFQEMLSKGEFLEFRSYQTRVEGKADTWFYGMTKEEVKSKDNPIVILDLQGAEAFQDYFGKENCTTIYVHSLDETREERARNRGSFDETEWKRRLTDDNRIFSERNINRICDDRIVNEGCTIEELKQLFDCVYYHVQGIREMEREER